METLIILLLLVVYWFSLKYITVFILTLIVGVFYDKKVPDWGPGKGR